MLKQCFAIFYFYLNYQNGLEIRNENNKSSVTFATLFDQQVNLNQKITFNLQNDTLYSKYLI